MATLKPAPKTTAPAAVKSYVPAPSGAPIRGSIMGDRLILDLPISPSPKLTEKGNLVIASTRGNRVLEDVDIDGNEVLCGVNVYYHV